MLALFKKGKNVDRKNVLFNNSLIQENVTSSKTNKKTFEITKQEK